MIITIHSTNLNDLRSLWRRVEPHYDQVNQIQFDRGSLDYKLMIKKSKQEKQLTYMLRLIADKIVELDDMIHDQSFFEDLTFEAFVRRTELEIMGAGRYPAIHRLLRVWHKLSEEERREFYHYLVQRASERVGEGELI